MSARRPRGFSLGEVLLATLFLSIAFFGYVALHQRLIYSSWKIELRQAPREEARSEVADRLATARRGRTENLAPVEGVAPGLWRVRGARTWTESAKNEPQPIEKSYRLDTYTAVRRPGW